MVSFTSCSVHFASSARPLRPLAKYQRRVGGHLVAVQVKAQREPQVDVFLDRRQIDAAQLAHVLRSPLSLPINCAVRSTIRPMPVSPTNM